MLVKAEQDLNVKVPSRQLANSCFEKWLKYISTAAINPVYSSFSNIGFILAGADRAMFASNGDNR